MNTFNENLKEEMESIAWTSPKETKTEEINQIKPESEQQENTPKNVTENAVEDTTENVVEDTAEDTVEDTAEEKKDKAKIIDANKNKQSAADKKKRNIKAVGDRDWVSKIPEDQLLNEKTIVCFDPNKLKKIGPFTKYGKKEGMVWFYPYKKNSFEVMSREWAVPQSECDIVEKDGVLLMPEKYYKDDNGYHLIDNKAGAKVEVNPEIEADKEVVATAAAE